MSGSFPFEFVVGGSHTTKNGKSVPDSPKGSGTQFKSADASKTQDFLSFDGVKLKMGDTVYQIGNVKDSYKPTLRSYTITDFISDGRIRIVEEIINNNISQKIDTMVYPKDVHSNAIELLKYWIINLKHKINIELPSVIAEMQKILLEKNPDWSDNLIIGEGISEEMEI